MHIPITRVRLLPRRRAEEGASLRALGKSLMQGQLQAIGVMELADEPGWYQLIWGERRLRAAQLVRLPTLEAVVLPPTEAEAAILIAWRENSERADLTDVERLGVLEQLRTVQGTGRWKDVESALAITETERKRLVALNRLDPEALAEVGQRGLRAYVLEPLLVLIRQRRDHGQRSIPEAMQVRIIRELAAHPSIERCRQLVQTYYPAPASGQRPEPERLVSAFASRLASLTDAIQDVRQASQLTDTLERQSLVGSIGRSISQLERLKRELAKAGVAADS